MIYYRLLLHGIFRLFFGSGELNVIFKRLAVIFSVYFSEWGSTFMLVHEFHFEHGLRCLQS